MFSPRSTPRPRAVGDTPSPAVANQIASEYAALRCPGGLPRGVYVTPSADSILRWEGVLFVRSGPYARAVLRLSMVFETDFPKSPPSIRFDSSVFHPMVDPKSREWTPRGSLGRWQPGVHHVTRLLHALVADFTLEALESVTEEQAVNKQLHLLYRNSNHTFLSMTAQRSIRSSSRDVLFPRTMEEDDTDLASIDDQRRTSPTSWSRCGSNNRASTGPASAPVPVTPTKPSARTRLDSGLSSASGSSTGDASIPEEGTIRFRPLNAGEKEEIEESMRRRMWSFLPPEKDNVHAHDGG